MSRVQEPCILRVTAEGPLLVRGQIHLLDEQGNEVRIRRRVNAICRCGRSASQPFCDGTHKIVPFSPRAVRAAAAGGPSADSPLGG